jgi:hypothetical protein
MKCPGLDECGVSNPSRDAPATVRCDMPARTGAAGPAGDGTIPVTTPSRTTAAPRQALPAGQDGHRRDGIPGGSAPARPPGREAGTMPMARRAAAAGGTAGATGPRPIAPLRAFNGLARESLQRVPSRRLALVDCGRYTKGKYRNPAT